MADRPETGRLNQGYFVGSYRIRRFLRALPCGELYIARSPREHRQCLLTVFRPDLAADAGWVTSLTQAADTAAQLDHPHIARVLGTVCDGGIVALACEYVDSGGDGPRTMADEAADSPAGLPHERCRRIALQLADALAYAHAFAGTGVCHGSLTLDDLLVDRQGRIKLAGIGTTVLTTGGRGTQAEDIAAAGAALFRACTGREWDGASRPSTLGAPRSWDAVVSGCLDGSFTSAEQIRSQLEEEAEPAGGTGRVLVLVVAAGLLLAAVAAAIVMLHSRNRDEEQAVRSDAPPHTNPVAVQTQTATDNGDARLRDGLALVRPAKEEAEALLQQVLDLNPAQGFDARIAGARQRAREAQAPLAALDFETAADAYRQLTATCRNILDAQDKRRAAADARRNADLERERAEDERAATRAKDLWEAAAAQTARAENAFEKGEFAAAADHWNAADQGYARAALAAGGRAAARKARSIYLETRRRADRDILDAIHDDAAATLERTVTAAEAHMTTEAWDDAAETWQRADALLVAALDASAARGGRTATGTGEPIRLELPPRPAQGNIIANGTFEQGRDRRALHWSGVDGITCFWERKGNPGHCLRFDPTVLQKDKKTFTETPAAYTGPSQGGQYQTVGAHEGVWAFAPPIQVLDSDRYFIVEADVWGPRSTAIFFPQVLIRGFQPFDPRKDEGTLSFFQTPHEGGPAYSEQFGPKQRRARPGDYLMVFRHGLVCRIPEPNRWHRYRLAFKVPEEPRFRPEIILLKAYAMWPLGEYRFDNISLRACTEEEFRAAPGHSIKGFMQTE